jgi:hypothetical protein
VSREEDRSGPTARQEARAEGCGRRVERRENVRHVNDLAGTALDDDVAAVGKSVVERGISDSIHESNGVGFDGGTLTSSSRRNTAWGRWQRHRQLRTDSTIISTSWVLFVSRRWPLAGIVERDMKTRTGTLEGLVLLLLLLRHL